MQISICIANNPNLQKKFKFLFFSPKTPAYKPYQKQITELPLRLFRPPRHRLARDASRSSDSLGSAPAPVRCRLWLRPASRRQGSATPLPAPSPPPGLAITIPGRAPPSYDLRHKHLGLPHPDPARPSPDRSAGDRRGPAPPTANGQRREYILFFPKFTIRQKNAALSLFRGKGIRKKKKIICDVIREFASQITLLATQIPICIAKNPNLRK